MRENRNIKDRDALFARSQEKATQLKNQREYKAQLQRVEQATQSLFDDVENTMSFLASATREGTSEEDVMHSAAYETWLALSIQIQEHLFGNGQALLHTIEGLLTTPHWTMAQKKEAEEFVITAAPLAIALRTVMESYAIAKPDMHSEQIVAHFCVQPAPVQTDTTEMQHTATIFGLCSALAQRLRMEQQKVQLKEETQPKLQQSLRAWEFHKEAQLPTSITIEDPFDPKNSEAVEHWYIMAAFEQKNGKTLAERGAATDAIGLSKKQTERLVGELSFRRAQLEAMPRALQKEYRELIVAYQTLEQWIESVLPYYNAHSIELLNTVDLFSQSAKEAERIFESLVVLKNHDDHSKKLFIELCGHNTTLGAENGSRFFGSALHVMLYNTQRTVETLPTTPQKLGESDKFTAIKALFAELLAIPLLTEEEKKQFAMQDLERLAKEAALKLGMIEEEVEKRNKDKSPEEQRDPTTEKQEITKMVGILLGGHFANNMAAAARKSFRQEIQQVMQTYKETSERQNEEAQRLMHALDAYA